MHDVIEKDFLDEATLQSPFTTYRWARENSSILKMPGENFYGVFSAELIDEIMRRPEDFSSDWADTLAGRYADDPEIQEIMKSGFRQVNVLLTTDPPLHTHQRKLVNMAFSKPRVDAMADDIRRIVTNLIDGFIDQGGCEFNSAFAMPLPVQMIANQYGLGDVPNESVKKWSDAISDRASGLASREREVECAHQIVEFHQAMVERITARREKPHDDLLSDLVNARVDGEPPLDDLEMISILQQLVTAGNETTTAMLGMGLLTLIQNPAQMTEIRSDMSRIPAMVEEMLRYDGPVSGTLRVATRDIELGGILIPARSKILARLAAANRDPAVYDRPDDFDPTRKNVHRHFAFGRGVHTCLGNMLARRELTIAFEQLLGRLDNIALADEQIHYHPSMITRGLTKLEIQFERAQR